jgi:hypothetical protein
MLGPVAPCVTANNATASAPAVVASQKAGGRALARAHHGGERGRGGGESDDDDRVRRGNVTHRECGEEREADDGAPGDESEAGPVASRGQGTAPEEEQDRRDGRGDDRAAETHPGGAELRNRHPRGRERAAERDDRQEAQDEAARFRRQTSNVIACSHKQE